MAPPTSKQMPKAIQLLSTPHPKHPERNYTAAEAAKKTGVALSTLYRHLKKQEQPK